MHTRVLTGITTTGTPHLGNYVGAIRPAVTASKRSDVDAFYFMADYHALIKSHDAARVQRSRLEIAATWLAAGLDPDKATFYRQSDIPEIPELTWFLTCATGKGLLNRAHAYKAAVDANRDADEDPDAGVTAGLYMYPVLMAADILAFNANQVPVGRDQIQHIEMARDIAQRFNHLYEGDFFTLPEAAIEETVATLPGLDGRKMSKSYDNTIPLFAGGAKATRAAVMRIVTDSREPGEPKQVDDAALFTIYRAFADEADGTTFRTELEDGLGWGEAKKKLVARLEQELAPMRERYAELMNRPDDIEDVLQAGAAKARRLATPLLARLRDAVGLGAGLPTSHKKGTSRKKSKTARAVSFRDKDGTFRFRLLAADGEELALSRGFDDPRAAGQCSQAVLAAGTELDVRPDGAALALLLDGERVAATAEYSDSDQRSALQARLREELARAAGQA